MNEILRRRSLHTRFVLGLGAVLLPFMLAAALGMLYLLPALIAPLEAIIGDVTEEMEPVRHVQIALLTAAVAASDQSAGGPRARTETEEASRHIEAAFDKLRATPSFDAQERGLIESAWTEWRKGRPQAAQDAPVTRVAYHAERAAAVLDDVYVPARRELERSRDAARAAKTTSLWVTFAAFTLALAISLYASARLAGSVVADIDGLRQGALRLAGGELSHRVNPGGGAELDDLASAFNTMAERIERDQAALAELATTDGLTGLDNRRKFLACLSEELDRSRRYAHPCALLMLDVDHFKAVNDTFGHPAGDEVLRAIAARIRSALRPTDHGARYGGEEFAILLPETTGEGALTFAERVRTSVAAGAVIASGRTIRITVSIGVAVYPEHGHAQDELISAADQSLYAAKEGGRDRVVMATREA